MGLYWNVSVAKPVKIFHESESLFSEFEKSLNSGMQCFVPKVIIVYSILVDQQHVRYPTILLQLCIHCLLLHSPDELNLFNTFRFPTLLLQLYTHYSLHSPDELNLFTTFCECFCLESIYFYGEPIAILDLSLLSWFQFISIMITYLLLDLSPLSCL